MDASRNYPLQLSNNFELHEFVDDPNFDQFNGLIIPGESEDAVITGFGYDLINDCFVNNKQIISSTGGDVFGFDSTSTLQVSDPTNCIFNALPNFDGGDEEEEEEDENSSETTATATKKAKGDRSRTLISERRRRGRMKEKLYALRSLVPNITKVSIGITSSSDNSCPF